MPDEVYFPQRTNLLRYHVARGHGYQVHAECRDDILARGPEDPPVICVTKQEIPQGARVCPSCADASTSAEVSDLACGAMLILVSRHSAEVPGGHEVVYVCMRDPHDRGRHRHPIGDSAIEWETRGEDQPVTRAASR